jgi:hypothetical protein
MRDESLFTEGPERETHLVMDLRHAVDLLEGEMGRQIGLTKEAFPDGFNAEGLLEEVEDSARYEMRFRKLDWSIKGVIGKVSGNQWTDMVRAYLHQVLKLELPGQQNGEWCIAAFKLSKTYQLVQSRESSGVTEQGQRLGTPGTGPGGGTDSPQLTKFKMDRQERLVAEIAIVEVTQAKVTDYLEQTRQNKTGSMYQYSVTGKLKQLPIRLRDERNSAKKLIREFWLGETVAPTKRRSKKAKEAAPTVGG